MKSPVLYQWFETATQKGVILVKLIDRSDFRDDQIRLDESWSLYKPLTAL